MKNYTPLVLRIILGLIFFVFGLNGFLHFMPTPAMPEAAGKMIGGLAASGYFFPLLKGTEVLCGALLIVGWFVPLALVILAPIVLNILIFNLMLMSGPPVLPVIIFLLTLALAKFYLPAYSLLLKKK